MYHSPSSVGDVNYIAPSDSASLAGYQTQPIPLQPTPAIATPNTSSISDPMSESISIATLLVPPEQWDLPGTNSFTAASTPAPAGSLGSYELSTEIWPLNIPPPETLYHLVETFFSSVPLATRLIHKPTFMAKLRKAPSCPDFPYVPPSLSSSVNGLIRRLYEKVMYLSCTQYVV